MESDLPKLNRINFNGAYFELMFSEGEMISMDIE